MNAWRQIAINLKFKSHHNKIVVKRNYSYRYAVWMGSQYTQLTIITTKLLSVTYLLSVKSDSVKLSQRALLVFCYLSNVYGLSNNLF
jgi:hypothetical protein